MLKYKLIGLDLDGTLLKGGKEISASNRYWIKQAEKAGLIVCFATGRGRNSSIQFWEVVDSSAPMVVVNGSEVWKNHNEVHARYPMPPNSIPKLHALALEYGTWYWAHTTQGLVRKEDWARHTIQEDDWLKFGIAHRDLDIISKLREIVQSWDELEVTSSDPTNLEIGRKGITKASGLAEVAKLRGIEPQEVVVMGDNLNDLEMIKWAGLGIAMGNAEPIIKEASDYITATNEEDGVAQAIQLILK